MTYTKKPLPLTLVIGKGFKTAFYFFTILFMLSSLLLILCFTAAILLPLGSIFKSSSERVSVTRSIIPYMPPATKIDINVTRDFFAITAPNTSTESFSIIAMTITLITGLSTTLTPSSFTLVYFLRV